MWLWAVCVALDCVAPGCVAPGYVAPSCVAPSCVALGCVALDLYISGQAADSRTEYHFSTNSAYCFQEGDSLGIVK